MRMLHPRQLLMAACHLAAAPRLSLQAAQTASMRLGPTQGHRQAQKQRARGLGLGPMLSMLGVRTTLHAPHPMAPVTPVALVLGEVWKAQAEAPSTLQPLCSLHQLHQHKHLMQGLLAPPSTFRCHAVSHPLTSQLQLQHQWWRKRRPGLCL